MRTYQPRKQKSYKPLTAPAKSTKPNQTPVQATSTTPTKSNEEGLAEWAAQQQKWARLGNPLLNTPPSGTTAQPWLQPKLTLGEPNDKYEQEADRVASQVVNTLHRSALTTSPPKETDTDRTLQTKSENNVVSSNLETAIQSAKGGGQPLENKLQRTMGQAMGADFNQVRVHTDTKSHQFNQAIQAKAFTTGQDLFFRQGTYQPGNREGQALIAHELTHVIQQNGSGLHRSPQQTAQPIHRMGVDLQRSFYVQRDPIEDTVMDTDTESLKSDIDTAMGKIKKKILEITKESDKAKKSLEKSGRDWMVYAPLASWKYNMLGLLENWDTSWSLEDTSGLLLDIGIAMKGLADEGKESKEKIMNDYMSQTRNSSKKVDKGSEWAKDIPEGTQMQAGVSATTGNLLKTLRWLNVNGLEEIEAIMNGIIKYWKNSKLKQALGQYHTAAEVWTAYTYHLEKYVLKTDE